MLPPRVLAVPVALAVFLLAGCQAPTNADLEAEFSQIEGVDTVQVDGSGVSANLVDDISATEAETAILELRDEAIERHRLGTEVALEVFIIAGSRDFGGDEPWRVYSYGDWSGGAAAGEGFEQQAAFVASLAEWDSLMETPAEVLHIEFQTYGPPDESPKVTIGQSLPTPNEQADIDVLRDELRDLWIASGGDADAVSVS